MKIKDILLRLCILIMILSLLPVVGVHAELEAPPEAGERRLEGGQRDLLWPVPGSYNISGCFLDQGDHYALDIDSQMGKDVIAAYAGKVNTVFNSCTHNEGKDYDCCDNIRGNYALVEHEYVLADGQTVTLYTRYSHLTEVKVYAGQTVEAGDLIGTVGSTGFSTGAHLDFEVLYGGINPSRTYAVDPFTNELLKMPEQLHSNMAECCQRYVAYVKEFYARCVHPQYDEHGKCVDCGVAYDWQATRKFDDIGNYTVATQITSATTPYDENDGVELAQGEQVAVTATVVNVLDQVFYEITMWDGAVYYVPQEALTFVDHFKSEITSETLSLKEGQILPQESYRLSGVIKSRYPLVSLEGYVDGTWYASWSALSVVREVELRTTPLNSKLNFKTLAPGEHTLTITAKDSTGRDGIEIVSCTFQIQGEPVVVPEPEKVTVTYTMDPENQQITLELGQPLGTLPQPEAVEGMYFLGWYTAPENGERVTEQTVPEEDMTLYPAWVSEKDTFKVSFDDVVLMIPGGMCVSELPAVSREGYRFLGWFTEEGVEMTAETVVTEAMKLHSEWEAMQFTVTLNPGEGTLAQTQLTVTYDDVYGQLPRPVRKGYMFMGWQLDGRAVTDTIRVKTAEDHTLVAIWVKETPTYVWALPVGCVSAVAVIVVVYFILKWKNERSKWK